MSNETKASVSLRVGTGGDTHLIVDGVDITRQVLRSGFKIEYGEDPDGILTVSLVLAPGVVEAELPEAIIKAVHGGSAL